MSNSPDRDSSVPPGGSVAVTGGTGFVGGYVIREVLAAGYRPVCILRQPDHLARRVGPALAGQCEIVSGDLLAGDDPSAQLQGCAAIVHLPGIIMERPDQGQTFDRVHIDLPRCVLEMARKAGIKRYLHMSALGTRPDAVSRYHQTKWQGERIVRDSDLDWTIFRPSLIHGPDGEFIEMMKSFCTDRLRNPVMPYFGSGCALLQPIDVRDVATCFVKALALSKTIHRTYELGGPKRLSWRELYDLCAVAFSGRRRAKLPVPVWWAKLLARTVVPLMPKTLMPYKFDVSQIEMSQEDSVCDHTVIEEAFDLTLRDFADELIQYARDVGSPGPARDK